MSRFRKSSRPKPIGVSKRKGLLGGLHNISDQERRKQINKARIIGTKKRRKSGL